MSGKDLKELHEKSPPKDDPTAPLPQPYVFLRWLFFLLIVRPLATIVLGLNVRHFDRLPQEGPAVIVANHNSHLDAFILMCLYPLKKLRHVRPVAAADYFFLFAALKWFALRIVGIIPLNRQMKGIRTDPLQRITEAIERKDLVILFPEGQRGEPEKFEQFKTGIAHLAKRHPDVPIVPVFTYGLGKALPRGEALLVPFFCDIFIGEPLKWEGDKQAFMDELNGSIKALAEEGHVEEWE